MLNASLLGPDYSAAVLAGRVGAGYEDGVGTEAAFYAPKALVLAESLGAQGALFVSDFKAHRVRKIDIATQAVSSVAGYAWKPGSQDGVGTEACEKIFCLKANDLSTRASCGCQQADLRTFETVGAGSMARFEAPMALALTADDLQLFVTDYKAESIRVIVLASGAVRTLTRTPPRTVGLALVSLPDPLGESKHGARVQALYVAAAGRISRLVFPCSPGYYREGNGKCYRCTAACGLSSETLGCGCGCGVVDPCPARVVVLVHAVLHAVLHTKWWLRR